MIENTIMQESSPKLRIFDLEERTIRFAHNIREFVKKLPVSDWNVEDKKQLVRSSGAIGANYIEANKSLGKRDFLMRTRTSRKEAKESHYWLQLIDAGNDANLEIEKSVLTKEADELTRIFSAMVRNYVEKMSAASAKNAQVTSSREDVRTNFED